MSMNIEKQIELLMADRMNTIDNAYCQMEDDSKYSFEITDRVDNDKVRVGFSGCSGLRIEFTTTKGWVGTTVGGTGSKTFKDGVEHHRNWREISVKEKAMFLKDIHGAAVELMSIGSTNLKKAIEEEAALAKKKETELEETLDILKSF